MNYLWEVVLKAREMGMDEGRLRFQAAKNYSAYQELSLEFLNQDSLEGRCVVEINPYYRFFSIFRDMWNPNLDEYRQLRACLENLIFHMLAENDARMGMTRDEYHKKLLMRDLTDGVFGKEAGGAIELFDREEREVLLSSCLRQYRAGSSLDLFQDVAASLIKNVIIYHSNEDPSDILIYVGMVKTKELERKVGFLLNMFLDVSYRVQLYYEFHFGIIGVEDTMIVDEITMC